MFKPAAGDSAPSSSEKPRKTCTCPERIPSFLPHPTLLSFNWVMLEGLPQGPDYCAQAAQCDQSRHRPPFCHSGPKAGPTHHVRGHGSSSPPPRIPWEVILLLGQHVRALLSQSRSDSQFKALPVRTRPCRGRDSQASPEAGPVCTGGPFWTVLGLSSEPHCHPCTEKQPASRRFPAVLSWLPC